MQLRLEHWADQYEESFNNFLPKPLQRLPGECRGRCQRKAPTCREANCPVPKPSRQGEVCIQTDLLGRSVQRWFQQLRRLQSFLHARRAGKETAEAVEYRASLWSAIRKAKGFEGGFVLWWEQRPTQFSGLPMEFPQDPPDTALAEAFFHDFQINYRNFESWHTRQRKHVLALQYEQFATKIFEVTRKEPKGGVSYLRKDTATTILASDAHAGQVHVDLHHELSLPASLCVADVTLPIGSQDGQVLTTEGEWLLQLGEAAEIQEHAVTPHQIQQQLENFWKKRWLRDPLPSATDWDRILRFAKAYLPPGKLDHCPITSEAWTDINKRYSPHAARGPDGLSHRDLQRMGNPFKDELVAILNECESRASWPEVLRVGFVHSLQKKPDACKVNEFRPVIIYSTVYRSWGSLRARRFLRYLSTRVDEKQLGFMEGREAAELWLLLQAFIEKSVQDGTSLCGFVTDLKKAFESLPRNPVFEIGRHLGLPCASLDLWADFLCHTERRFLVQGEVGQPIHSNYGFPEGCSLSCVAMSIAGLTLHSYMTEFSRRSSTISYVDNLELLAHTLGALNQGIVTMQTWSDTWKLELDQDKSYVWATEASVRKEAKSLGWNVVTSAKDLGAQMNYGKSSHVSVQTARLASLETIWPKLKRCLAPNWKKQQLLRQAIWPRAFYGVATCTLGWAHIRSLRTEAMKALGFQQAGAAPGLRLTLLCHEQCDPGFYQAWTVSQTFRRMAHKRPLFLNLWINFMENFAGTGRQGPFAKLLEVCGSLRWTIEAPILRDHGGNPIGWLDMEEKILYELVKDAWIWKVFREVADRKDLRGLEGIDWMVLQQAQRKAPAHLRPLLARLQDGTFVEPGQHAKYDLGKNVLCPLCRQPDSMEHRCTSCPGRMAIYAEYSDVLHRWASFSLAKRIHLLPSSNPFWPVFKQVLCDREDIVFRFFDGGTHPGEVCQLFTDGSARGGPHRLHQLGAWAVVDAIQDRCIARGALGGIGQGSARAELRAMVAAVEYAVFIEKETTIWTDCMYVAEGTVRLLQDEHDLPDGKHASDWLELQGLLCSRLHPIHVQHVPGHAPWDNVDQDLEGWQARWNDRADREANMAMRLHGEAVLSLHQDLLGHHAQELSDLIQLQNLHAAVVTGAQCPENLHEDIDDSAGEQSLTDLMVARGSPDSRSFLDALPAHENAEALWDRFGRSFSLNFLDLLRTWNAHPDRALGKFSFLELALHLADAASAWLPQPHRDKPNAWCEREAAGLTEPTVGALVRLAKSFFRTLAQSFCLSIDWCKGINLSAFSVFVPQDGLILAVPPALIRTISTVLLSFTRRRPVRRANDLSRPLRLHSA